MKKIIAILCLCSLHSIIFAQTHLISIKEIQVNGNDVTKESIILRELLISKNMVVSYQELSLKIKESKQNLINLKLFNFVEINKSIKFF